MAAADRRTGSFFAEMGRFVEELTRAGVLLVTGRTAIAACHA